MKKFYDIEIDSQVELENGKTLGKLEESQISVNDGNCGSGGWPADLPKPSVGGYGYTEQGEQTVITWDGDTDGHYTIIVEEGYNLVHVSDKTPNSVIGGSIFKSDGVTLNIRDDNVMMSGEWGYILSEAVVVCIFNDNTVVDDLGVTFEHKGIYFAKTEMRHISSLTYGTPDTVHKIDEKYLPLIPTAPSDDGTYTLTCTVTDGEPVYSWES